MRVSRNPANKIDDKDNRVIVELFEWFKKLIIAESPSLKISFQKQ